MSKAYSYIRFSTPDQAKGDSYRRQLSMARNYAAAHNLELVTEAEYRFFDSGVSAYRGKNRSDTGSLNRFNEYVKSGKIAPGSYLLVESLDRISRQEVSIALAGFLSLLSHGIIIVTLADKAIYKKDPDITQLIVSILHMGRAHDESKYKGQRVADAWQEKRRLAREQGKPIGAVCPYWLGYKDGKYYPVPEKVAVVEDIFTLATNGYGRIAISKALNAKGIPVFGSGNRNKSQLWGTSSVSKILHNRAVLGEYQPMVHSDGHRTAEGEPILGYYPRIITDQVFYAALSASELRKSYKATKQSVNFNIWSKIAICSYCKSAMHLVNKGKPPKGGRYLRCSKSAKGQCTSKSIPLAPTELVFKEILAKLNSTALVTRPEVDLKKELATLDGKYHDELSKFKKLLELLGTRPSDSLAKLVAEKEKELQSQAQKIEGIKKDLASSSIFDKQSFFNQLDLDSYEGRSEANTYAIRSNIKVKMKRTEEETIFTTQIEATPFFSLIINMQGIIEFVPLSIKATESLVNQSDLDSTAFPISPEKMLQNLSAETRDRVPATSQLKTYKARASKQTVTKLLKTFNLTDT